MVALTLCGTIAGANSWAEVERFAVAHRGWFEQFLELSNGISAHDAFCRVFARLDTQEFQDCMGCWVAQLLKQTQHQLAGEIVAINGGVPPGSDPRQDGWGQTADWMCT